MESTSLELLRAMARERGALNATLNLGSGTAGARPTACIVQPLWPWPCPSAVKRNRWPDAAWACLVEQHDHRGVWALYYLTPEQIFESTQEPGEFSPVDMRIGLDPGTRTREAMEQLALAIRFGVSCHFEYEIPEEGRREGRSAVPVGLSGGLMFANDHGRGGAMRSFDLRRIHELRLDWMRQTEGPVWRDDAQDYVLQTSGAGLR